MPARDSSRFLINMAEAAEAKEQSAGEFAVFVTLKILGVLISLYFSSLVLT